MTFPAGYQDITTEDIIILQRNVGEKHNENIERYQSVVNKNEETIKKLMDILSDSTEALKKEKGERDSYRNRYYVSLASSVCLAVALGVLFITSECK